MTRHWSFAVCDPRYLYPLAAVVLVLGVAAAIAWREPVHLNRAGNLVIGTGVWMSMRYTLREGLKRHKNAADASPVLPGTNQLNPAFFNSITFELGDAQLQVRGFILVVLGSVVGSFGDLILKGLLPSWF